jgi:hypothetical protein
MLSTKLDLKFAEQAAATSAKFAEQAAATSAKFAEQAAATSAKFAEIATKLGEQDKSLQELKDSKIQIFTVFGAVGSLGFTPLIGVAIIDSIKKFSSYLNASSDIVKKK